MTSPLSKLNQDTQTSRYDGLTAMLLQETGLREDQLSTQTDVLSEHGTGESYAEVILPDVVVYPESTADVQQILRLANHEEIPVTPVATNSSLEGITVPLKGGISLDMTRMNKLLELRPNDLLAICGPGLPYPDLNAQAAEHGLFFPMDPGAPASIAGMVSTNASGTAAVKYGTTADYVMALEVVLANGEVIRTGNRARKSSSGYNLTKLFCGAEGTLGVITEITLKLVGLPQHLMAARVPFPDMAHATQFATSIIQHAVPIARCEAVGAKSIAAVNAYSSTDYPEDITIFLEFSGVSQAALDADLELVRKLANAQGALSFEASHDADARERLWDARHNAYYAQKAANPGKRVFVTDVAVPLSSLSEVVTDSLARFEAAGFPAYLLGHVGDGNFHLSIFYDDNDTSHATLQELGKALIEHALSVWGTCTGEHGIGVRKLPYMAREHGASLGLMRQIKDQLDPKGILNPGKKLPAVD
ncbi:MAG: FAD-linked oxidase C-terminal domain-containing protein [Deinococcota bacterium]